MLKVEIVIVTLSCMMVCADQQEEEQILENSFLSRIREGTRMFIMVKPSQSRSHVGNPPGDHLLLICS